VELRQYLRALKRHWWVVGGVALVTVLALSFVWQPKTVYETSGTYVVRPRSAEAGETVRATEALNRGVEINATYARIARSDAVKERAQDRLAAQALPTDGLAVRSEVVAGTNILEIGATGSDPDTVAAYATAIGEEAAAYLDDLGEVYLLQELDPPGDPDVVASNGTLTMVVGVTFGLLAGAVLAFAIEYLREPALPDAHGMWDRHTGVYSDEYFLSRLRQELARCEVPPELPSRPEALKPDGARPPMFTAGLVTLSNGHAGTDAALLPLERRDAGQALMARLRPQDILAYVGDDTFAVLLPDLSADRTDEILNGWGDRLAGRAGAAPVTLQATVRTCECNADGLAGDEEIVRLACTR
jgi:capsular polysaccharide biosynthesis protein